MRINDIAPDFEAVTASWGVLCCHPKDCKIIGFSIDPVNNP